MVCIGSARSRQFSDNQSAKIGMNKFEELCELASRENWCWKLYCTTCGHMDFRYSFSELADGKSPGEREWQIHKGLTSRTVSPHCIGVRKK